MEFRSSVFLLWWWGGGISTFRSLWVSGFAAKRSFGVEFRSLGLADWPIIDGFGIREGSVSVVRPARRLAYFHCLSTLNPISPKPYKPSTLKSLQGAYYVARSKWSCLADGVRHSAVLDEACSGIHGSATSANPSLKAGQTLPPTTLPYLPRPFFALNWS